METKLCTGKNGCNKELPIESFFFYPSIQKHAYICKECSRKYSRKMESKSEYKEKKAIRMHKWHQTKEGRKSLKKASTKYYKSEKGKDSLKKIGKRKVDTLDRTYIIQALIPILKKSYNKIPEEMIEPKRQQLILHRYVRQLKTITTNESDIKQINS